MKLNKKFTTLKCSYLKKFIIQSQLKTTKPINEFCRLRCHRAANAAHFAHFLEISSLKELILFDFAYLSFAAALTHLLNKVSFHFCTQESQTRDVWRTFMRSSWDEKKTREKNLIFIRNWWKSIWNWHDRLNSYFTVNVCPRKCVLCVCHDIIYDMFAWGAIFVVMHDCFMAQIVGSFGKIIFVMCKLFPAEWELLRLLFCGTHTLTFLFLLYANNKS